MKKYYYSDGESTLGPFSLEEMQKKEFLPHYLVWHDGLEDWQPIGKIAELSSCVFTPSKPPPLPSQKTITETSLVHQISDQKPHTETSSPPTVSAKQFFPKWLIVWIVFHLFALLMSYAEIEKFNSQGEPSSKKFWPFVDFYHTELRYKVIPNPPRSQYEDTIRWKLDGKELKIARSKEPSISSYEVEIFDGLFAEYDWTEFAFYVGIVFLFVFLKRN